MHNVLLIFRNKEVNQSRGATSYSGGFTYHMRQSVRFDNMYESCWVRFLRVPLRDCILYQPALKEIQKHQNALQVNEVVDANKVPKMAWNLVCKFLALIIPRTRFPDPNVVCNLCNFRCKHIHHLHSHFCHV